MTARNILDNMYPPVGVGIGNKKANNDLTTSEINTLIGIVDSFEKDGGKFDWKSGVQTLSEVASRFITPYDNSKNNQQPLPLLIQQVIFYMAVKGEEYQIYNQAEFMFELTGSDEFNASGKLICNNNMTLNIGKILNKMPYEYKYYIKCRDYKYIYKSLPQEVYSQPAILFSYNGQKDKHLGLAIRNLAYQAGKYTKCVDVFGGTGSGLLAIPKRGYKKGCKRGVVEYIYNDLDKDLYNLYTVIKSDDYKLLIDELHKLKSALQGGEDLDGIDFDSEMKTFYDRCNHDSAEDKIYYFDNAETNYDIPSMITFMKALRDNLKIMPDDFNISYNNTIIYKADIMSEFNKMINDVDYWLAYLADIDFYDYLSKYITVPYKDRVKISRGYYDVVGNKKNAHEIIMEQDTYVNNRRDDKMRNMQARFYQYYAYFSNLLDSKEEVPIRRALGLIFVNALTTMGDVGVSEINRMTNKGSKGSKANKWQHFLFPTGKNTAKMPEQSEIIEVLHTEFQRIDLMNEDCNKVIKDITQQIIAEKKALSKSSKVKPEALFVVDSPYIATAGYKVGDFGPNEMKKLIDALALTADEDNKFIFCCRACATKASKASKADVETIDKAIVESVYKNFNYNYLGTKHRQLWVLAITKDSKKDFFEDYVAKHEETEIMITNYEIQEFEASQLCPKAKYEVYPFDQFVVKLGQYL